MNKSAEHQEMQKKKEVEAQIYEGAKVLLDLDIAFLRRYEKLKEQVNPPTFIEDFPTP
jgi:hypothetical protein